MEHKRISDFQVGDLITGYYIINNISTKVSKTGEPYLEATLSDRSGSIDAKAWRYYGKLSALSNGSIAKLRADVTEFRGRMQLVIREERGASSIIIADNEAGNIELAEILPVAPIDEDAEFAYLISVAEGILDSDFRTICLEMLRRHTESLKKIPAGKTMHHDFIHGLLMHTSSMVKIADFLSVQYKETISRDLLVTGTILHDLSKSREFLFSDLGLVSNYSTEGQLIGHLVMGAEEIKQVSVELGIPEEKSILLQHMILSHHGIPEYGAAVRPMLAEAELLYMLDYMDSRMEIFRSNLQDLPVGNFSDRIFGLDNRKIFNHGLQ